MKSFAELRKRVERERAAGKRDRVTPTQWRNQLLATVQLAAALGLRYSGYTNAHGEVYRVDRCEIPDGWHPISFDIPAEDRQRAFYAFRYRAAVREVREALGGDAID